MSENQPQAAPEISQEAYSAFVRELFNRSGDPAKDFTHAMLGIVTEIHELMNATDEVNALEELGDMSFYAEALSQVIGDITGENLHEASPAEAAGKFAGLYEMCAKEGPKAVLKEACNDLLDVAKRWVGYGKAPENFGFLFSGVVAITGIANFACPYPCTDNQRINAANMAKLMKRYKGGKYSQLDALNRDLEAEREVLASA